MSASKEELFERMPVTKAIFNLTIPMIIGSVVSIAYNLADTFFVGQLNDPVQNAAVTLVAPAMTLFYAILISAGTLLFLKPVLVFLGTNEETYAVTEKYLFWTVGLGAVPGILNILFSFIIRAEGRAMLSSIGAMSGCLLNIFLDPIFILPSVLNMGAGGAGLATFISSCFAFLYFAVLFIVLHGKTYVSLNPKSVIALGVLRKLLKKL